MTNENFYVGVRKPRQLRADLLRSGSDVVDSLMKFEKYKKLRHEKLMLVHELTRSLAELSKLNNKLRAHLPKGILKSAPVVQPVKEEPKPSKKKVVKETLPKKSKLDRLREKLDEYERKASQLS